MKLLLSILATLIFTTNIYAQQELLPSPDAKALGMGGVSMTSTGASHAIYNNAAMAAFSRTPVEVSSSYYGQSENSYYALSGSTRIGMNNTVLVGWRHFLRETNSNDLALDFGYTRRLGERWGVGVAARYMHLKRPYGNDNALSVDLSAAYQLPLENLGDYSMLRAGARLSNLGGYIKGNGARLPMDMTAGVALDTYLSDAHEVTIATDLGYLFTPSVARSFKMSVGAEYNLMQLIQLRGGYHYSAESYYHSYATVGAGVRFMLLRLDFAYLFAKKESPLHNTYSISFGLDF